MYCWFCVVRLFLNKPIVIRLSVTRSVSKFNGLNERNSFGFCFLHMFSHNIWMSLIDTQKEKDLQWHTQHFAIDWKQHSSVADRLTKSYNVTLHYYLLGHGVLASEGWWEAWQAFPQGNQELLVVRDKVGRPSGELGVSKSMECDIFPSVLWHCWLGDRKGIRPVKKLDVGLLVMMIWLELSTTYSSSSPIVTTTSIILCFNKHQLNQVHLENGR